MELEASGALALVRKNMFKMWESLWWAFGDVEIHSLVHVEIIFWSSRNLNLSHHFSIDAITNNYLFNFRWICWLVEVTETFSSVYPTSYLCKGTLIWLGYRLRVPNFGSGVSLNLTINTAFSFLFCICSNFVGVAQAICHSWVAFSAVVGTCRHATCLIFGVSWDFFVRLTCLQLIC